MPGVDTDTTLPPDGLQQAQGEFLPGIFRVRAEVFLVPHLPIAVDDVVRPLEWDDLIRPRVGILRGGRHERFDVEMMDRVADRRKRPFEAGPDPFDVVLHPLLDAGEPEARWYLVYGLDPPTHQLLKRPLAPRQVEHPARRLDLSAVIPERTLVGIETMVIGFYGRR